MADIADTPEGVSRRDLLIRVAAGLAAAAGLGSALRGRLLGGSAAAPTFHVPEDSIFAPRADQRDRMLRGK